MTIWFSPHPIFVRTASALSLAAFVMASGCSTSSTTSDRTVAARVPELTLTVASLDLSGFNKRLEKSDVAALVKSLQKEKVEVLAVQNLSRYPGLATRVDLLNELTRLADWRQAFGEMVDNSGHQVGNAVFSAYPIRSSNPLSFHGVKGAVYEGAIQAVVDGGVMDILFVSALLPPKATESDKAKCIDRITSLRSGLNIPLIVGGNLPPAKDVLKEASSDTRSGSAGRLQYVGGEDVEVASSTTIPTPLGTAVVVRFSLFRHRS